MCKDLNDLTCNVAKSETRMVASILKQDPYIKGSKEYCIFGQNTTCKFSG